MGKAKAQGQGGFFHALLAHIFGKGVLDTEAGDQETMAHGRQFLDNKS